ncbi:MAG: hypothetical protein KDE27_23965 [Planctomycetes bacterium]|nr:hypothetical protein [Planctomycetota bacterium]
MTTSRSVLLASAALAAVVLATPTAAQGGHILFTTTQPEQTLSGSGGTVLATIRPNEIAVLEQGSTPCSMLSAEKWAPATTFHTQAGDTDNDDQIFETSLFGRIDALLVNQFATPTGITNQRTEFYSVKQAMGTTVSGAPGFRPGDVARIVRDTAGNDGQIQYFLRQEDLAIALGLPATAPVDIDAVAWGPNFGVFFSIEDDMTCNLAGAGITLVRDGDILCIPPANLTWNPNMTVASTVLGGAVVVYKEADVDLMVQNARITDRFGVCQNAIDDTDALEVDWNNPFAFNMPSGTGFVFTVPHLVFAGSNLTGAGVLNTLGGGTIHNGICSPLGTHCTFGPTLGNQMGLRPPAAATGVASSVNGLAFTRVCRFVTESPNPQVPVGNPVSVDVASPGPLTWMLFSFAPAGPGVVAPSSPFPWGLLCYPDYYGSLPTVVLGPIPTPTGWGNYTSPAIPFPVDFVIQGVTFTSAGVEASTPTTVEVF